MWTFWQVVLVIGFFVAFVLQTYVTIMSAFLFLTHHLRSEDKDDVDS